MLTPNPDEIKKILIRVPNWIGDAVLAIPALSAIRAYFDGSEITFLGPNSVLQLLRENRLADDYIGIEYKKRGLFGRWRLIRDLKLKGFNLAILLQNAFEAALIAFMASIPIRLGYRQEGRGPLLTHPINPPEPGTVHQLDYYLNMIQSLIGPGGYRKDPYLRVTEKEKHEARRVLSDHGIGSKDLIIGINAGAAYGSAKRWVPERFGQLGEILSAERNFKLIFFGSTGEYPLTERIIRFMSAKAVNLAGRTTIRELAALISQCSLFITNDSGPMHIASALRIPVVSLFGPTDNLTTSPTGIQSFVVKNETECSPCLLRECPIDHRCMTSISVEEVLKVIHNELGWIGTPAVPAVFLDRDGTLNEDTHYVSSEEKFHLFKESTEAIALFNEMEIPVFIITNQSGIGRGMFTEQFLQNLHLNLLRKLGEFGSAIKGIYYCPHHPDEGCRCRKPKTGLIEEIVRRQAVKLNQSYVVGDQISDMILADRLGAKGILVLSGQGRETLVRIKDRKNSVQPDHISQNILDAALWIREDIQRFKAGSC